MEKFWRGPVENTGDGSEKGCVGFIVKDNHHRGRGHPRWILAPQTSVYGEEREERGEEVKEREGRRGGEDGLGELFWKPYNPRLCSRSGMYCALIDNMVR